MKSADLILTDATLSHQVYLLRFTAGEQEKVADLLMKVQKELTYKLTTGLTDFGKSRVRALLKEVNQVIDQGYNNIQGSLNFSGLANHETDFTVKSFAAIGVEVSLPTVAVMKALVNGSLIDGAASGAWWAKQSEDLQFKFAAQVRQGIAANETLQDIIRRVAGSPRLGTPGIMEISRRNASALVHTSIMQVANDARLATYQANADVINGVQHLATFDAHTCAQQCVPRSGAEWDLDGNPIKGNFPFQSPPLHFNCRCVLVPITRSFRELGIDVDEVKGTRASDLGQIDSGTSFDAFLSRHDVAYQDELLGKGKADLWRSGKITLRDLVSQNGRPLTLAELKAETGIVDIKKDFSILGQRGHLDSMTKSDALTQISADIKAPINKAEKVYDSFVNYSGNINYEDIRSGKLKGDFNNIEGYINSAPKWGDSGALYRGIVVDPGSALLDMKEGAAIDMKGISSWTSSEKIVSSYTRSHYGQDGVLFTLDNGSRNATSIAHLSRYTYEEELLMSKAGGKSLKVSSIEDRIFSKEGQDWKVKVYHLLEGE